ncbi:unnamed protein product [Fraxinus pennsylvanica]|uniref:GB1/RHD3-type G domain-containing protein n=1 Tax=Fraxinus pennsylvanica TaxID=56036 RepID=A0AAD2DYB8_9LAMI|nr:unnamed protein product [Fraxinus pennsylvanica]
MPLSSSFPSLPLAVSKSTSCPAKSPGSRAKSGFPSSSLLAIFCVPNLLIHMDKSDGCCSTHLIDGDGNFNVAGLDMFMKEVKLAECGLSYAVVSIMGPQSSGMNF